MPLPVGINVTVDGCKLHIDLISVAAKLCSNTRASVLYGRIEPQQGWQHIQRNINARSRNHCSSEKAVSITYSVCVSVDLGIHHPKRMRHTILFSVAVWLYNIFRYHLTQTMIFGKRLSHIKCVFWFSLHLLQESLIIRIIQRYIIINAHRSSCMVPVILVTV